MNFLLPHSAAANNRFATSSVNTSQRRRASVSELMILGNRRHKQGRYAEAETVFRAILDHDPHNPAALHFLGVIAHQTGKHEAAVRLIKEAVAVAPNYHQAYNNLGNVYEAMKQPANAAEAYARATELRPDYADALFNLGVAQRQLGELQKALDAFSACMRLDQQCAETHFEIGKTYQMMGSRLQAQIAYKIALELDPKHLQARHNLANLQTTLGRVNEALSEYEQILQGHPDNVRVLNSKGVAQRKIGLFEQAIATVSHSDDLDPDNVETLSTLGAAYQTIGDNEKAFECYRRATEIMPDAECAHKSLLFVALNLPALSSQALFDLHRQVRGPFDKPALTRRTFPKRDRNPHRRLRIGYLSSDFRTHVVGFNMLPLISSHDHAQYEIFLYGQIEFPDQMTDVFRESADHWRSTQMKSNERVAREIEEDEIDILVILAGRFDENRPIVASYRAAPIQVSYHDCATSGLEAMDYWLTDAVLHPADTPELFTEQLYRLPAYYQYPRQDNLPAVKAPPVLTNGHITFGCFNKPEKINDEVVALWAEVLKSVPGSRLMLKYFNHYSQPAAQAQWEARFAAHGIAADRLMLRFGLDQRRSHLELYDDVDIALDPFPFNGATTTFESLCMGVPVISLRGRHFVDRVAASMMTHVGLPEWIADTRQDYVRLAADLAGDHGRLSQLRGGLRDKLHASPLCDSQGYTRTVESAYRDMWQTWCATGGYKGR
jgi:protein O-GlcNAc transferase